MLSVYDGIFINVLRGLYNEKSYKNYDGFGVLFSPLSLISQDSDGIEEVIVSATKTESNVQDLL